MEFFGNHTSSSTILFTHLFSVSHCVLCIIIAQFPVSINRSLSIHNSRFIALNFHSSLATCGYGDARLAFKTPDVKVLAVLYE